MKLSPYPSCRLAHPLELASFVLDGKVVSNDRRGKAALRAERQAFQRHKAACFHDATNEVFRRLHLRPLGADQSEDHQLFVWDVPERCKRARPIIVVFEEKPHRTDALEKRPGNWLIVARDEPTAFLVATTEMDGEGHVGKSRHDGVVELDPAAQPLIERPASRFIKAPSRRRQQQGIVRRVDLNIGGAEAKELRDLITQDRDDVGEEVLEACIRGSGTFRRPEIHEQAGAGQGYLCDAARAAAQIDELLGGKVPFAHEPADHAEIDRPIAASLSDRAGAVPMAPQECIEVPGAEAVDRLGHRALERKPPHFAVGHDVEPRRLLKGDGLIDGAILYGLELRVIQTPGHPVVPRFAQRNRSQKTANNIGACRNHRRLRRSDRRAQVFALYCGNGSKISKIAPCGLAEAADRRPPWASTIERQIDNPIPIPLLLLVKNGSKMRFNVSGSIPGPESSMATIHSPFSVASDLSRKTREPAAVELMASIAFMTKLKMTCCN